MIKANLRKLTLILLLLAFDLLASETVNICFFFKKKKSLMPDISNPHVMLRMSLFCLLLNMEFTSHTGNVGSHT